METPPRDDLHVGFVTGRNVLIDDDGLAWAHVGLGRLLDELATRFTSLSVLACRPREAAMHDYQLTQVGRTAVHPLPPMSSFGSGSRHTPTVRRAVRAFEASVDVAIVQLSIQAPLALLPRRPRLYHLFGDVEVMGAHSTGYSGARAIAARLFSRGVGGIQRHLIAEPRSRLVANGAALFDRYGAGRGQAIVSSHVLATEIGIHGRARPASDRQRLLFVGYLRPEKGVDTLLQAYLTLLEKLPDLELRVVGPVTSSGLERRVTSLLEEAQAVGTVSLVGAVPFGPALWQEYADADALMLPSRSEGTPRVLVEARAAGCPVIASRVGGIPSSVTDGRDGLLCDPDDAGTFAEAAFRVLTDERLRSGLRQDGFRRVTSMTVGTMADTLAQEVRLVWAGGGRP